MIFCLAIFLAYHLRLAIRNETTNEECKRDEILYDLRRELKIIKASDQLWYFWTNVWWALGLWTSVML